MVASRPATAEFANYLRENLGVKGFQRAGWSEDGGHRSEVGGR